MENKEFETNKKSYNRLPDEQPVKKFDETKHVDVQKENVEDDLLLQTEKKSFNRLPNERDEEVKTYNERSHVDQHNEKDVENLPEIEKKSYNRKPDETVEEFDVHENYKSKKKE